MPKETVRFLAERLKLAAAVDEKRIAALITAPDILARETRNPKRSTTPPLEKGV